MKPWLLIQTMIASLIFFPTKEYAQFPDAYGLQYESVQCTTEDGVALRGWYIPAKSSRKTIFFLHGNAGNISDRVFKADGWVKRGYSVFLLDYRGYGDSEGQIQHENDLYRDAEAGLKWLKEKKHLANADIIMYGESIGSAPALYLTVKTNFHAIILEAPFTSLPDMAKKHYPFVPSFILHSFQMLNIERISQIKTPVFILHGQHDEVCPYEMGQLLFQAAPKPKEFLSVPNGLHNNLPDLLGASYYNKPIQFMRDPVKAGFRQ